MIRIRDPLHGTIQLTELEGKLLDTPQMQRLRNVRQLAMAYLVYPGANHTRFEHSIGTLALADKMAAELGIGGEKLSLLRLAALLHDIGHTAFSHEAEAVLSKYLGDHESIGEKMVAKGEISDILGRQFSPKEVSLLYRESLGGIITSDIGADRMDYLLRDSHYTGVAYGVIDTDRVCSTVGMDRKGMFITDRGLPAAESLLVARFTMFSTVYLHKTVRIASRMLQQAIMLAIEDGTLQPESALCLGDSQMLQKLSDSPSACEFSSRLQQRRLYKKAHSLPVSEMRMKQAEAEETLSEKCGCSVLIDVPRISLKTSIRLMHEGKKVPLSHASELVASLEKMQESRLEAMVLCEEGFVKKAAAAAEKLFGRKS